MGPPCKSVTLPRRELDRPNQHQLSCLGYCAATVRGTENSEVSAPTTLSAVAVTLCPARTARVGKNVKVTLPLTLVLTASSPRNLLPSLPEGLE